MRITPVRLPTIIVRNRWPYFYIEHKEQIISKINLYFELTKKKVRWTARKKENSPSQVHDLLVFNLNHRIQSKCLFKIFPKIESKCFEVASSPHCYFSSKLQPSSCGTKYPKNTWNIFGSNVIMDCSSANVNCVQCKCLKKNSRLWSATTLTKSFIFPKRCCPKRCFVRPLK